VEIVKLHYPDQLEMTVTDHYSLAIGFFDGIHKGHRAVIRQAVKTAEARSLVPAVMTFDPHPSYLFKEEGVLYLTPLEEKVRQLEQLGVEVLFIVTFDWTLASLTPSEFIDTFIRKLHVQHVTAGFDFTFGRKGEGTMKQMKELANGDYTTTTVEKVTVGDEKVSSTRIRQLLTEGEVEKAERLLARPYRTIGTVVDGAKRGRTIGFPTANLQVEPKYVQPKQGVYAVHVWIDDQRFEGVCNVGVVPTFETGPEVSIEVHILSFNQTIYGEKIAIDWKYRLRDEMKFKGVDALVEQIAADKEKAIQLFQLEE